MGIFLDFLFGDVFFDSNFDHFPDLLVIRLHFSYLYYYFLLSCFLSFNLLLFVWICFLFFFLPFLLPDHLHQLFVIQRLLLLLFCLRSLHLLYRLMPLPLHLLLTHPRPLMLFTTNTLARCIDWRTVLVVVSLLVFGCRVELALGDGLQGVGVHQMPSLVDDMHRLGLLLRTALFRHITPLRFVLVES